jgi:hypothetical protein
LLSGDGQRLVAVGSDVSAHDQACALLDVLSLHAAGAPVQGVQPTDTGRVTVVVGRGQNKPGPADEALDALRTLRAALRGGPDVQIMVWRGGDSAFEEVTGGAPDYAASTKAAHYKGLLDRLAPGAPAVLRDLVDGLGIAGLRAYPMLAQYPFWSLRLERAGGGTVPRRPARQLARCREKRQGRHARRGPHDLARNPRRARLARRR